MADEAVVEEQGGDLETVDPAIEAEARRGGWKPQDQYTGRPEHWVDAQTFVQRGREVLPHVQRHNKELERENANLKAEQARLKAEQDELKAQVTGLTTFQQEMAGKERERIRNELAADLRAAREANDTEAEARILGQLSAPPPPPKPVVRQQADPPARPAIPQEMIDWTAENDWYRNDPVLATAMNTVGADLRAQGKLVGMSLTEQLNATAKVVLDKYAPQRTNGASRTEGGRPSGGGGGGPTPQQNGWDSLSAQAKTECDAQGERLGLIGKGKSFPTIKEWRTHYVTQLNRYAPGVGYDYKPPGN